MKKIRGKLTYANVIATLALFLVLTGGAAYAASHLGKNSVGTKQLKKNSVTSAKIKKEAVTGAKIKLSSVGKVPSASRADTAGDAGTLQGHAASAFMQGGGQFFSARRELAIGESGVLLFNLPGIGPVFADCQMGTTYPRGGFEIVNNSGSTMEQTLQYSAGVDGGAAAPGKSIGFGGQEYVDAVTVQVATRSPQPVIATLNLSFLKTDANNGCNMIGQATVAGG
jgi:hypothetical protein